MSSQLYFDECLSRMAQLPEQSVDAVICDPPYGFTACAWDAVIPFEPMWAALERLVKPRGPIVLTCNQPFTSALVMSKPKWYRHCWVWDKVRPSGFQCSKHRPMMQHEDVMVFSKEPPNYRPLMLRLARPTIGGISATRASSKSNPLSHDDMKRRRHLASFPRSILSYIKPTLSGSHPTQKPVELLEYLIRTYTREGETVLDFTMGSGTTGVACVNTNRNFIGIELDPHWYKVAENRVYDAERRARVKQPGLGLGIEDPYMAWSDAVSVMEEEDPPLGAAIANGGYLDD